MSYEDQANLAEDVPFNRRLSACLAGEARAKSDSLSASIMTDPVVGAQMFMSFISTAPGFGDTFADGGSAAIDDASLLSAVQANWDAVAAIHGTE